jgi:hypothetical protein
LSIDNFTNITATDLPIGTTFVWKEGVPFSPAQTAATLDLNIYYRWSVRIHNYSVSYIEPGCTEVTDEIKVEIYPKLE